MSHGTIKTKRHRPLWRNMDRPTQDSPKPVPGSSEVPGTPRPSSIASRTDQSHRPSKEYILSRGSVDLASLHDCRSSTNFSRGGSSSEPPPGRFATPASRSTLKGTIASPARGRKIRDANSRGASCHESRTSAFLSRRRQSSCPQAFLRDLNRACLVE